jgi:regulator of protease activity HflC (stomatin/prohibitin superfamily)
MTKQELRDLVDSTDARTLSRIIENGKQFSTIQKGLQNEIDTLKRSIRSKRQKTRIWAFSIIGSVLASILALFIGLPKYNVYRSEMRGKAELVEAEQNRKIQIEEAKANVEAAQLDKQADSIRAIGQKNAEIIRAEGMAKAMDIENGKLTDSYIKYLWVRNIDKGDKIYIPTESGMPLLEARN